MDPVLTHLDAPLSLARVARAAAMSPRTLARRFDEEAGLGFRRFLRQARVQAAMERLSQPGVRIGETAAACGFKSEAAFTHAFKAVTGELPRAYRARFPARSPK
jgi:AraC-like DNA-binding protein